MADLTKAVGQSHRLAPYQVARPKARKIKKRLQERKDLGGPGSGNFGHAGRPGEVGGSGSGDGGVRVPLESVDEQMKRVWADEEQKSQQRAARARDVAAAAATRDPAAYPHNKATYNDVHGRLKELVPDVFISELKPTALTAASHVLEVLEEMHARGYDMPDSVMVEVSTRGSVHGQTTFQSRERHLTIDVPEALPDDANLDDAAQIAFGGSHEDQGRTYDRFSVRTMRDVVLHEMGHVQAGHRGGLPARLDVQAPGLYVYEAARQVSLYAATSADEFMACSFVRLYRGETLSPDAQKLYDVLEGPKVKKMALPWPDLTTEEWRKRLKVVRHDLAEAFEEAKHPRDAQGEFSETPGGPASGTASAAASASTASGRASVPSGSSAAGPATAGLREGMTKGPLGETGPGAALPKALAPQDFPAAKTLPTPTGSSDGAAAPSPKLQPTPTPPSPRSRPTPDTAVRATLHAALTTLAAEEKQALLAGYEQYLREGQSGSFDDFFAEQVALYRHAEEGDPRLKTWFSGETLTKLQQDPALNAHLEELVAYQKTAAGPDAAPEAPAAPAAPAVVPAAAHAPSVPTGKVEAKPKSGGGGGGGGGAPAPVAPKVAPKPGGGGPPVQSPLGEAGNLGPQVDAFVRGMAPDEQQALAAGYAAAQAAGYAGTPADYFVQQAALYQHAEEGDPRLGTYFSGDTLTKLQQDPAIWARVQAIATTQQAPPPRL